MEIEMLCIFKRFVRQLCNQNLIYQSDEGYRNCEMNQQRRCKKIELNIILKERTFN